MLVARGFIRIMRRCLDVTSWRSRLAYPVSLAAPSVHTLYHAELNLRNALVVGVSQSGEGTDINLVLENAKKAGAFTLGITNESRSAMAQLVDEVLLIQRRQRAERGCH